DVDVGKCGGPKTVTSPERACVNGVGDEGVCDIEVRDRPILVQLVRSKGNAQGAVVAGVVFSAAEGIVGLELQTVPVPFCQRNREAMVDSAADGRKNIVLKNQMIRYIGCRSRAGRITGANKRIDRVDIFPWVHDIARRPLKIAFSNLLDMNGA